MKKVFWDDPYQTKLITTIKNIPGNIVLLAETIAFSFSGGQESDKAFINGTPIINSKIEGNLIYYILPDHHGFKEGDKVEMTIDWPRRYRLMRLHFAAELILELISPKLKLEKIGAHISEHKARIDFLYNQNISFIFEELLQEYNDIIKKDLVIEKGFDHVLTERRYWKIDGFHKVACGGTHVKSTAEVGYISLKRVNIGSGKERIEIKLI